MGELVHPGFAANTVKLAREGDFKVGRITVNPPTRQIFCGTEQQTLEPRVMQVLVVLARAGGNVVSKEELIECCWNGRIVGEDAINRVASRLRHLAGTIGGGSFQIDTVRGVGYRLVEAPLSSTTSRYPALSKESEPWRISRRTALAGSAAAAGLAVAGLAAAGGWPVQVPAHRPSPVAIQYYRRGLETRGQNSLELAQRGAALFREATRIDPEFAAAWGALAWSYRGLLEYEYGQRKDAVRLQSLSRSAAARALELEPDNADAHAALLLLKPFFGNWAAIEEGCRRLLKRHPDHSILEYNLGFTLTEVGRWRESLPYFRNLAGRERFWPLAHLALTQALFSSGRVQEAEDHIEEGLKRFPGNIDYWLIKVRNLTLSGRMPEAMAFARDTSNLPAERSAVQPEMEFEISLMEALADGSQEARNGVVRRVSEATRQFPPYIGHAAIKAAIVGNLDESFAMLEGLYFGEGPWSFTYQRRARTTRLFVGEALPLRNDPRFPALLRRTGLEAYWRTTGTTPDYRRFPQPEYRLPIG